MALLEYRLFLRILVVVLLSVGEISSHLGPPPYISSFNILPSTVMRQNIPLETIVASRLQIGVTVKSSNGAQNFDTTVHRNSAHTDSVNETLSSRRCSTCPLKFRKNKFVALDTMERKLHLNAK
ncbi:hypothetical protein YC2023_043879 [Brassica napus]